MTDDNSGPMDRVLTSPANGEHWMVYEVIDHHRNNENLKDTGIKSSKYLATCNAMMRVLPYTHRYVLACSAWRLVIKLDACNVKVMPSMMIHSLVKCKMIVLRQQIESYHHLWQYLYCN